MTKKAWMHEQYKRALRGVAVEMLIRQHVPAARVVGMEEEYPLHAGGLAGIADGCITVAGESGYGIVLAEVKAGRNAYAWKHGRAQLEKWYRRSGRHAQRLPDPRRRARNRQEDGVDAV